MLVVNVKDFPQIAEHMATDAEPRIGDHPGTVLGWDALMAAATGPWPYMTPEYTKKHADYLAAAYESTIVAVFRVGGRDTVADAKGKPQVVFDLTPTAKGAPLIGHQMPGGPWRQGEGRGVRAVETPAPLLAAAANTERVSCTFSEVPFLADVKSTVRVRTTRLEPGVHRINMGIYEGGELVSGPRKELVERANRRRSYTVRAATVNGGDYEVVVEGPVSAEIEVTTTITGPTGDEVKVPVRRRREPLGGWGAYAQTMWRAAFAAHVGVPVRPRASEPVVPYSAEDMGWVGEGRVGDVRVRVFPDGTVTVTPAAGQRVLVLPSDGA